MKAANLIRLPRYWAAIPDEAMEKHSDKTDYNAFW